MHDTSYGNVDKFMQSGFVVDDVEAMRGVERRWEAMRGDKRRWGQRQAWSELLKCILLG